MSIKLLWALCFVFAEALGQGETATAAALQMEYLEKVFEFQGWASHNNCIMILSLFFTLIPLLNQVRLARHESNHLHLRHQLPLPHAPQLVAI
jgi:hypothetical protein